ncbi:MAG TPA: L-aspartate oxidase [Actinomycetes bacterium]|jgi:L-aspartate oxidase|nr:L-aspartate oxidase [Actinomycetes bacterium]
MLIPRGLLAADPADLPHLATEEVDVLVVGSGVAGLSTALAVPAGRSVLLATKDRLGHSATRHAQGGIAAVLDPVAGRQGDSVAEHLADTLAAGAGLCDPVAVRMLVEEGGQAIAELHARGVRFDRDPGLAHELARTREGGHSRSRVVHAGGDATGAELERALTEAVRAAPAIRSVEHAFLVDLVTGGGQVVGALLWVGGGLCLVRAAAVVLASGGAGQLYADTTNPPLSTGDGLAAALRAGAVLADLEFVQFHPTALHVDGDPRPLISEAMRGEGAVLRDGEGTPVMAGAHPLADLAPRDVVARGMAARMAALGVAHLWLDATAIPGQHLERRFPTILARCRAAGIEPTRQPIPVSPAAHYLMGGVVADLDGRTSLPGLFAVGEAACTGVHGANRLASNSLLEGVVFAARIGRALSAERPHPTRAAGPAGDRLPAAAPGSGDPAAVRARLRRLMTDRVGVVRSGLQLAEAVAELDRLIVGAGPGGPDRFETANLVQLGRVVAELAARREESRGGHWRSDHPAPAEAWRVRQTVTRTAGGDLEVGLLPVAEAAEARR